MQQPDGVPNYEALLLKSLLRIDEAAILLDISRKVFRCICHLVERSNHV